MLGQFVIQVWPYNRNIYSYLHKHIYKLTDEKLHASKGKFAILLLVSNEPSWLCYDILVLSVPYLMTYDGYS